MKDGPLILGLVLCIWGTCGADTWTRDPVMPTALGYCFSSNGKCQYKCDVNLQRELPSLSGRCGGRLRCCVQRSSARLQGGQQVSSSNVSVPTSFYQRYSQRQTTTSPSSSRQTQFFPYRPTHTPNRSQRSDTKTDTSALYDSNSWKSTGCGRPVLSRARRIVGGTQAQRCVFPWMVRISRDPGKDDVCGGTLVSNRHVVTAAHCFDQLEYTPILYIGEYRRDDGGTRDKLTTASYSILKHPYYNRLTFSYDIAILTLDKPIQYQNYVCLRPICLPPRNFTLKVGATCTVAGWGSTSRTDYSPAVSSSVLMKSRIRVLDGSACRHKFGDLFNSQSLMCAGDLKGTTDSCVGDSGGPLMCGAPDSSDSWESRDSVQYLMGVISSGATPCAQRETPALYTDIQKVRDWLQSVVRL